MDKKATFVKTLDGKSFYYAFLAGAQRIFENQGLINKINVFPVADADTGTNLASTFRSIVDCPIPVNNIKTAATALADAALVGARGNSGIIFAQFLYGFSNEIKDEAVMTVESFSRSISKAVTYAYEAIANPVEGTMISVIREWAEFIHKMKDLIDDFVELLVQALQVAIKSLAETTQKLEVLAKANVVDAGAKGFVLFLEGMIDFFKNSHKEPNITIPINDMTLDEVMVDSHEEITFRYCCEAMLALDLHPGETKYTIRKAIEPFGDSLVVAGSEKRLRIHIHSDEPIELFQTINNHASITYQKVDDMVMQKELSHHAKWPIALISDSTCDIPDDILEKNQISIVPLSLHVGETHFLDRTTISSKSFYNLLETSPQYPSTAQPSYKDFINKYAFLSTHFQSVIALNISGAMSGTFSNSQRAAKAVSEQSGKPIFVHNSKRVSGGLGLIILRAAQAIEQGKCHEDITNQLENWSQKVHQFVTAKTAKYMVKSGRVSRGKGMAAKLLNIKPIIKVNSEGKAGNFGKAFSEKSSMRHVMAEIKRLYAEQPFWGYTITHVNNLKSAQWYAVEMEKLTGKKPIFIADGSPVLGVNVGPSTVSLSVMHE